MVPFREKVSARRPEPESQMNTMAEGLVQRAWSGRHKQEGLCQKDLAKGLGPKDLGQKDWILGPGPWSEGLGLVH